MSSLTLKVNSYQKSILGENATLKLTEAGCRFGRSGENDWMLPDPERFISSHHGAIEYRDGVYYLIDTSLNGIYVNQSNTPLGKNNEAPLEHGDTLSFGDYVVKVAIEPKSDAIVAEPLPKNDAMFSDLDVLDIVGENSQAQEPDFAEPDLLGVKAQQAENEELITNDEIINSGLDKQDQEAISVNPGPDFGIINGSPLDNNSAIQAVEQGSILEDVFTPPSIRSDQQIPLKNNDEFESAVSASGLIPEDWDQTGYGVKPNLVADAVPPKESCQSAENAHSERFEPLPVNQESAAQRASSTRSGESLLAFCRGLGVDPDLFSQQDENQIMEMLGSGFRELLTGILDLLRARSELKNEFRMSQTTIQAADNNPLKFSLSLEMAVRHLYADSGSGNMAAEQAIGEAVTDLRKHQLGLMMAMEQSFESFLTKIHPHNFQSQKQTDQKSAGAVFSGFGAKSKAWDQYQQFYQDRLSNPKAAFRQLFAEEFADSYNDLIQRWELE